MFIKRSHTFVAQAQGIHARLISKQNDVLLPDIYMPLSRLSPLHHSGIYSLKL